MARTSARVHKVKAELSNFELTRATSALRLQIYAAGGKIGELQVGRGSLYWWGKNKKQHKRLRWPEFTAAMNALAYGDKS